MNGKRQTFPRPTAHPADSIRKPSLDFKLSLFIYFEISQTESVLTGAYYTKNADSFVFPVFLCIRLVRRTTPMSGGTAWPLHQAKFKTSSPLVRF